MPLINKKQTNLEKLNSTQFKNLTLQSRASKLTDKTREFSNSIIHSMSELERTINHQINDVEISSFKKAKNIRSLIKGQSDLLSNILSENSRKNQNLVDHLHDLGRPKQAPDDNIILQLLIQKGVTLQTLREFPELANTICSSDKARFLFGEKIANTALDVAFKFNLKERHQDYLNELETKTLINDYETEISAFVSDMTELSENAVTEEDPSAQKEFSKAVLNSEPSVSLEGSGQPV